MPSIIRKGSQAAADGRITREEAQALVAHAQKNGVVSGYEKAQLRRILTQHRDLFDPAALDTIRAIIERSAPASPPGGTVALDPSDAHRPVFLSSTGVFSLSAEGAPPRNDVELGEALFRAGELVDDSAGNVFADVGVSKDTRAAVFQTLQGTLAKVPAGGTRPARLDANQALQLRASSATVLLHLMEATAEPELSAPMLDAFRSLVLAETDVRLRENLIFHFANSKVAKAGPAKELASTWMRELAPMTPPYEKWFADGNKTINLHWKVGDEFHERFMARLEMGGFQPVGPESRSGVTTFEKKFNEPGVGETVFRISVQEGGSDLLAGTGKKGVHIMGYDGHSNWGRNMTSSIERGPDTSGGGDGQLFIYDLCVGKGVLDQLKKKYPNLQVVTTFGSAYRDTEIDSLCAGIARRDDWEKLTRMFNDTDGYSGRNNFLTPISTLVRERVLDRDSDGQADYLDKHFNFSTFSVPTDTQREMKPVKQARHASILDGTKVNVAAQILNAVSEFSSILDLVNKDSKVVAGGWFEPKLGEKELVRFTQATGPDGKTEYRLEVNARYSHMSEEALRATVVYEFGRYLISSWQLQMEAVDAKLNGLIGFAQSLDIDEGFRDDELWVAFLARYNLPNVDRDVIQQLLDDEHHHYAGSPEMVAKLRAKLSTEVLAALRRPEAGEPVQLVG
ncbi:MAG: tellurite resistance TerB family protein [Myxococcota bacterium]